MKPTKLLYCFLILLLGGCADLFETTPMDNCTNALSSNSNMRTISDAIFISEQVADAEGIESRAPRRANISDVQTILGSKTRSEKPDTLMYAVNFENNQGFILVAADKRIEPVLAIIDNGSFKDLENENNESYQLMLENAKSYAVYNPEIPRPDTPQSLEPIIWYAYSDTIDVNERENPRITVKWNQTWPENMYCPNFVAGCGPIASLQILSFIQSPTSIRYTYPNRDIQSESINWTNLIKHNSSDNYKNPSSSYISSHLNSCSLNENGHKTLARLARELGHQANANYKTETPSTSASTSVTFDNMKYVITNISGHLYSKTGYSMSDLFNDIKTNNHSVALVRGNDVDENGNDTDGHEWVADATLKLGMIVNFWSYTDYENKILECSTSELIKKYVHFNWGWGGNCNGYFLINIINPYKGYRYDDPTIWQPSNDTSYDKKFRYVIFSK